MGRHKAFYSQGSEGTRVSEDLEDYSAIYDKITKHGRTVTERRKSETRVPTYGARRKMAKSDRTEQTNLKFTPATKKRLIALSEAAGESMVEYIERAIEIRATQEGTQ